MSGISPFESIPSGIVIMAGNRQLLLTRLSERLHGLFDGLINLTDVASKPEKDIENFFLTRSLAALKLFNDSTSAAYLWNIVQLMAAVDGKLVDEANELEGRERLIAVHGNRFILFRVFSLIDLETLRDSSFDLTSMKLKCEEMAVEVLNAVIPAINEKFPDAYPGNIFKNQDRQAELLTTISS